MSKNIVVLICLIFCSWSCGDNNEIKRHSNSLYKTDSIELHTSHEEWRNWKDNGRKSIDRIESLKDVIWESGIIYNEDSICADLIGQLRAFDKKHNSAKNAHEARLMAWLNGSLEAIDGAEIKSRSVGLSKKDKVTVDLSEAARFLNRRDIVLDSAEVYLDAVSKGWAHIENNQRYQGVFHYLNGKYLGYRNESVRSLEECGTAYEIFQNLGMKTFEIEALIQICWVSLYRDTEKVKKYLKTALETCNNEKFWLQKIYIQNIDAFALYDTGDAEASIEAFKAIIKGGDPTHIDLEPIGEAYIDLAKVYLTRQDLVNAVSAVRSGQEIIRKVKNPRRDAFRDLSCPGLVFAELNEMDSARYYLKQAHDFAVKLESKMGEALMDRYIGELEFKNDNLEESAKRFENSLKIYTELGKIHPAAISELELGKIKLKLKEFESAKVHFYSAKRLFNSKNIKVYEVADISNYLSELYFANGKLDSALYFGLNGLEIATNLGAISSEIAAHANLINVYEYRNDIPNAYSHIKRRTMLRDSISNFERSKAIGRAEADLLYKSRLANQKRESEEVHLKIQRSKQIIILYSIIATLLMLSLGIFSWLRAQRIKLLESVAEYEKQNSLNLKKLSKQRTRIMADIAHDFRTPLNLIQAPLSDMINGSFQSNFRDSWKNMKSNADILLQLINQMLELSQLDEGFLKPKYKTIDIVKLLDQRMSTFQSHAVLDKITLVAHLPDKPIMLEIEENFLNKIINNILSNAIKYTNQGGQVTMSLVINENSFDISFQDTGVGMTPTELERIFSRYQRLNTDRGDEIFYPGGLGLSIVSKLMSLLEGKVDVKSVPNEGSTFTITLPHKEVIVLPDDVKWTNREYTINTNKDVQELPEGINVNNHGVRDEGKRTILIVEDNRRLNDFIAHKLSETFNVIQGFNGIEGEELAKEHLPDIILTDMIMPHQDGLSMSKILSSDIVTSHIPIIFFSMNHEEMDKIRAFRSGGIDFLEKPISIDLLILKIENLFSLLGQLQTKVVKKIDFSSDITNFEEDELSTIDQKFIRDVVQKIQENIDDSSFNVTELAKVLFLSRTQCFRKLKNLTGLSPKALLLKYRMEHAMKLITNKTGKIGEIGQLVGYSNASHFSRVFSDYFGLNPTDVNS